MGRIDFFFPQMVTEFEEMFFGGRIKCAWIWGVFGCELSRVDRG